MSPARCLQNTEIDSGAELAYRFLIEKAITPSELLRWHELAAGFAR